MPVTVQCSWMLSGQLGFGWDVTQAFNSKGCEAALFPLCWVLITLCLALKSSLLSQRPSLAAARQVRLQNDLQPFVVLVYGRFLVSYKTWK